MNTKVHAGIILNPYMVHQMSDDEIRDAMKDCDKLLGTSSEKDACLMYSQYRDELASRRLHIFRVNHNAND